MAVMIKDLKHCDECTYQYGCSTYMAFKKIIDDFTRDRQIYERCGCPLVEIEEPKTEHWVDDEVDSFSRSFGYKKFHCSRCLKVIEGNMAKKTDYCPNCGAKMVEPQESEET